VSPYNWRVLLFFVAVFFVADRLGVAWWKVLVSVLGVWVLFLVVVSILARHEKVGDDE
jgi:NADH:ubiquinone oxidoreductase subunit 6 (subunit J)